MSPRSSRTFNASSPNSDETGADTIELCLDAGAAGVLLLRQLLRRLINIGRREVSIVVHWVR